MEDTREQEIPRVKAVVGQKLLITTVSPARSFKKHAPTHYAHQNVCAT